MATIDTLREVEQLKDVTHVEKGEAPKTYRVGLFSGADVDVLAKIESASGWSVERFDGAHGDNPFVVCIPKEYNDQP